MTYDEKMALLEEIKDLLETHGESEMAEQLAQIEEDLWVLESLRES